jgi:hypothetical protein
MVSSTRKGKQMAESIRASVGKFANGTRDCHNVPADQLKIIRLLNQISDADGGRRTTPLAESPLNPGRCASGLHEAILAFQRRHHLSVDGHVDPGQQTLRKLNELATSSRGGAAVPDPVTAVRLNPDYVERRIKGVGIFGLGGPFRFDLEINSQNSMPIKSFFMDRAKFSLASDPFKGRTEIALTATIYPSEQAALAAIRAFPVPGNDNVVYAHYRGQENVIFPTTISDTTAPAVVRALRLALDAEREYARSASKVLLQAFFTLAGLRYMPVPEAGGAAGAASELSALRETARRLIQEQPAGRAVLNLGGTGEVTGAINVNPLIDQQVVGVPNLVRTTAERIGEVFPAASADSIVSNNVVFGQVNWAGAARGCFTVLKSGGRVSIAPYAGQLAEHLQAIAAALRDAGFRTVNTVGPVVTAIK